MYKTTAVAAFLIASTTAASPALAADQCPINDAAIAQAGGYANAVEAIVKSAPDCERAYKTLEICQLGSSGDNALSDIGQKSVSLCFSARQAAA